MHVPSPPTVAEGSAFVERKRHFNLYTVVLITFVGLGSASYGYAAAIIGTTLGQPSFQKYMGLDTNPHTAALEGAMNGLYFAGGVVGAFCCGWMSNKYGRKGSLAFGALLVLISGALLTGSVNPAMFIVFRFFSGWGSFQLLATTPLWVSELVPPKDRGMLTDISTVVLNFGYLAAGYIGLGFYFYHGGEQWRAAMAFSMLFPALLLSGIYWAPESPRYLLLRGRHEEAWNIVYRLHSDPHDPDHQFARREFYQMRKQIEYEATLNTSYAHIFKTPSLRKRAFITTYLTFSLMSCGVLVINNYGALLYSGLGYDATDTLYFQTGWTATAFVFNIVAMTFVDRIKRPYLIATGFFSVLACLICEAALQKTYLGTTSNSGLGGAVAMLYIFSVCYALFLDGPTYFYIGEIWPTHLRAQGFALGIGVLSATNIVWLEAAPTAFANIGWKYYIFFMVFALLGGINTLLWFPDTLHKPLEEISALFGDTVQVYQRDLDNATFPGDEMDEVTTANMNGNGSKETEEVENVESVHNSQGLRSSEDKHAQGP